jgi:hypothetical protein
MFYRHDSLKVPYVAVYIVLLQHSTHLPVGKTTLLSWDIGVAASVLLVM